MNKRPTPTEELVETEGTIHVSADGIVVIQSDGEIILRPKDALEMAAKLIQAAEVAEAALQRLKQGTK